ncbi:Integrin-linked protein kinase [Thalictrum thalictroides]|uniref:Integrin-linked protein kinase n=1 Tax=Thalictrum thalictroides TaxID=46969 RepID=A0A7J6UUF4_THATH|nr:Integrin-linked protein kinase [Thalictrum thalictroides]
METKIPLRKTLVKQSSLAPEREDGTKLVEDELEVTETVEPTVRLMYLVNEGDLDGINELLDLGTNVNFSDIDGRTALHIAACQGRTDVVELLIRRGAQIDPKDCWGSTPLADAIYYKNHDVIKLLEKHGAKPLMAPMHVLHRREIPEYEIDPTELDFTNSRDITKGTFRTALWRGIQVAVKRIGEDVISDEDKVTAFRDELELLQKIRHPNVVQFLGAVTQSSPMMIVTEYLPKGDLCAFLKRKKALKQTHAVKYALDIARGMNYLHENKPEPIIHRDLEPSNILRDDSGHLKVADFGLSKLLKVAKTVREDRPVTCTDISCRYLAPEVFKNEEYDMKVDVFSFALILQEMIEGCPPFSNKPELEVPKAYVEKERPPFRAPTKHYSHGLRELIEDCWSELPARRPTFRVVIERLDNINKRNTQKRRWKVNTLKCFQNLEAIWKRDRSVGSTRSSHSSTTR